MTTQAPKAVLMVLTNCTDPAREQEFNDWYTNVHIPDVLLTPGIVRGTRFRLATEPREGQNKYLALYELHTDDAASVQQNLGEVMVTVREQGRMVDCLQVGGMGYYVMVSDQVKDGGPK